MSGCQAIVFKKINEKCTFLCEENGEETDPYEVIYDYKKKRNIIKNDEGLIFKDWFEALMSYSNCDSKAWIMFSVYYDLRERGRILKTGPLPNSFTMFKGVRPDSIIIVLEETIKFRVEEIFRWIETAKKMNRDCILAVVDKHGDVSYYKIELASLNEISSLS